MNAFDLWDALNQADEKELERARSFYHIGMEEIVPMKKTRKAFQTLLIAAVITALMGVTAFAAGLFQVSSRAVEEGERFQVSFKTPDEDIVGEWPATYALEFDGAEECQAVRYRFNSLPEGVYIPAGADGWIERADWKEGEIATIPWCEHVECTVKKGGGGFFVSDMFYMPCYVNDGALILMNHTPDQMEEEDWDGRHVIKITSDHWKGIDGELHDLPETNYVLIIDTDQGWIFAIRGTASMDDLLYLAKNLEVEQTEEIVRKDQFEKPYDFFDAARG